MATKTTVRRIRHATHFGLGLPGANDLIEVDSIQECTDPRPQDAKSWDATFHHGYIDASGRQHAVFLKSVRSTDGSTCERCKGDK
jgi:hypothetical protein